MKNDPSSEYREWKCRTPLSAMRSPAYRKYAAGILLIEIFSAIAAVIFPLTQKMLIDGANKADRMQTIYGAAAVALLFMMIRLGQKGSYLLRFRLGMEARWRLRSSLFRCTLGLPEHFLKDRGSGYFFNRLQADSTAIVQFYYGDAMLQFSNLLKFVLGFSAIAWLHRECALLILPVLPLQFLIYRKYRKKQYLLGKKTQECTAAEQYRMQEYLSGHATLKTHNAVRQAQEKLAQDFSHWRQLAFLRLFHENRFQFLLQLPMYLCCGSVAVWGLEQVLLREWTLGGLWALLLLLRQVFAPVRNIAAGQFRMQSVQAAWDRMRQIVHASQIQDPVPVPADSPLKGEIRFSHVAFAYSGGEMLFRDLNLSVKANELLFLTGPNGAGKSTIFQLLLRLYDPLAGEITIGGLPIRNLPPEVCRARIGYLGQTPEFFPGTLRENILLDARHPDEKIMAVLQQMQCEDLLRKLPAGLDSPVTENALNFSGGERLRIALARELLRDTDILLLDEPTSSLDAASRKAFYELLQKLHARRTIIVITHDDCVPLQQGRLYHL